MSSENNQIPTLLDVVALIQDLPAQGLIRGQVGTVVESLGDDVYEIEFSDEDGRTYAQLSLKSNSLMVLHHRPYEAA
ncbi:MAG: DUF4926 domain-containing protein [Planctomycetes bacterium]|nr:DUF4926 domain-containing protein [Planctomycetota bacterium]